MAERHFLGHIVIDEEIAHSYDSNYDSAEQHLEDEFGWIEQGGIFLRDYKEVPDSSNMDISRLSEMIEEKSDDKEIHIRNISADICSLFEDILDNNDFTIPDSDRTGEEGEARLYGETYSILEDAVTSILTELCKRVQRHPKSKINSEEY